MSSDSASEQVFRAGLHFRTGQHKCESPLQWFKASLGQAYPQNSFNVLHCLLLEAAPVLVSPCPALLEASSCGIT